MVEILNFIASASTPWGIAGAILIVLLVAVIVTVVEVIKKIAPKIVEMKMDEREKRREREYQESSRERNERSETISNKLNELVNKMNAVHGVIFEFHNGGHNNSGLNFQHMSLHYMEHKFYAQNEIDEKAFENLSLGCYPLLMKEMEMNQAVVKNSDDADFRNYRLFNRFTGVAAKQFIAIPLHGVSQPLGFVILMREVTEKLERKDYAIINEYSQKLSSLLDLEVK